MKATDWLDTKDYKLAEAVNFISVGGEELEENEIYEKEITNINRENGYYEVEIDVN